MKRYILFLILLLLAISCQPKHAEKTKTTSHFDKRTNLNNYLKTKQKAIKWINELQLDLPAIQSKKLGEKKFLAEYIGFYWKRYKNETDTLIKKEIRTQLTPYYQYTLSRAYHNMQNLDDKLFKKNSMSYLRVMWLFRELGFDITSYRQEVLKIKPLLDAQLGVRGNWQKEVFKDYYHIFNLKMPSSLINTHFNNGIITQELPLEKYNLHKVYNFTHFIFAGFEYGNKTEASRFNKTELHYIEQILPQLAKRYRTDKPNIDILGELVTCMIFLGYTDTPEFKKSYRYLLEHQNPDGSWGAYEKARKKIGNDIDFRAYLHTTLVVFEALEEYNTGAFLGSKKG